MRLVTTAKVRTDAIDQFLHCEQAGRLDDMALAMHPVRLHPIEPGALAGQVTGHETHILALLLDLAVVRAYPITHRMTDVPGGIVPDHEQGFLVGLGQLLAAPAQRLTEPFCPRACRGL